MQIAMIADDLTGAADSAAAFAQRGLSTLVTLRNEVTIDADLFSLSTDSRDCTDVESARRVERAVQDLLNCHRGDPPCLVYKKMDSALRGHPAAELIATMRALGIDRAIVASALPDEQRFTTDGRQYLDGVPLEQTLLGRGLATSDLLEIFQGAGSLFPVSLVKPSQLRTESTSIFTSIGIFVADAATNEELDLIAKSALDSGFRLLSGSAGLARAIARVGEFRSTLATPKSSASRSGSILSVIGSQHESTLRQIEFAASQGLIVLRPNQSDIDEQRGTLDTVVTAAESALAAGRHVIVTTAGLRNSPMGSIAVAERLSTITDSPVVRSAVGGMLLTGGDVAAAVCARLGASAFWLTGEVRPAIPRGYLADGAMPGLPIVTKAGSFGSPDTIADCIADLSLSATDAK